ncbi:BadF/BadG/BcrA/BcrD ATPase family protein [Pontibacter roseus]|uniref:BadF/BadG/BcrA/BcrD ATPase family protein n=1 Tax=Pontibacter roseus TaxID=336989 RepID=UPI0003638498|nr:BadF/BadG/BcrA/BcrD ATPase family protein [Pontibacter roseus]
MILIADSGSTKTDWRIIDADNVHEQAFTTGINPQYLETEKIYAIFENELLPQLKEKNIHAIYYYGAGCSSPERNKRVEDALRMAFPSSEVYVDHDLLAAARAVCGHQPGIACILGTGSNSCLYDGRNIVDNVPSLGFLMGDEGSGAYMGKLLIKAYLYRELPDELAQSLKNRYNLTKNGIIDAVYGSDIPSRYLATFAKFMHEKRKNPIIKEMIYENFEEFFERHVSKYEGFGQLPVNFVGSIAFFFADTLKLVAKKYGAQIGVIIQSPGEGLVNYHQELLKAQGAQA